MQLNFSVPFNTQTDASGRHIGGTWQLGEGEKKRPVADVSRKPVLRETQSSVGQLECLAFKWTMDRFKYCRLETEFSLENDHRALKCLETMKLLNYLLAAVSTDTLLHIKCPQLSFMGKWLPAPFVWKEPPYYRHADTNVMYPAFSYSEIGGQLCKQKWHLRFICLFLCWRMLLLHIDADNYIVGLTDYRRR